MPVALFLSALALTAAAPPVAADAPIAEVTSAPSAEATALDRTASAAGAATGAAVGTLAGLTVGSVGHILLQPILPTFFTIPLASTGAPVGAMLGVLVLGSPFLESGAGALWVAAAAGGAAAAAQLVVGIPFIASQGRPFGSYELGIVSLLVVPPAAAAVGAAVVAPFFAAPSE